MSPVDKEDVVTKLEQTAACCCRPGIAQDLKKKNTDMRLPENKHWLLPFALAVTMSLGNTERQHAANKAFCKSSGDQVVFEQFVAQSVLGPEKGHRPLATMSRRIYILLSSVQLFNRSAHSAGPTPEVLRF